MFSVFFLLFIYKYPNWYTAVVEFSSVQKLALGACLTHNGLEKCNQIQRKVMAPLHVHVCNNKGILTVLEYFYSSTVFVNVGGRG